MIGGGPGAFIGDVHRIASRVDGQVALVCGVFSRDFEKTKTQAAELGLSVSRAYPSLAAMLEAEAKLPENERMHAVSIVTPNAQHYGAAKAAMLAGFHVICDKPPTISVEEVEDIEAVAKSTGRLYALTFTYLGYPMVNEVRQRVAAGEIGAVRKVFVTYPQGWLSNNLESTGNKQADWRTDPAISGPAGCLGDIGSHAHSMAEYITGQKVNYLCADLPTFVERRRLDDDVSVLLKFDGGARGVLMASQIMAGEENDLSISVYGETGGFKWKHSDPNSLIQLDLNGPTKVLRAGVENGYLLESTRQLCRTPSGHPEGYLEAFANIYTRFAQLVHQNSSTMDVGFGVADGVRSMRFIRSCLESNKSEKKWTEFR